MKILIGGKHLPYTYISIIIQNIGKRRNKKYRSTGVSKSISLHRGDNMTESSPLKPVKTSHSQNFHGLYKH